MVDQKIDPNADPTHAVENALTALWDKAREASYLISTLRDERKKLQTRVEELELELAGVRTELGSRIGELERMQDDLQARGTASVALGDEERRALQQKIRNIMTVLDQYLAP
ncbi:MAG: hypothetical protein F9K22_00540 [Bacteroidetes bacterium]|nr:MAG: hypothetical protein F9K22_00540 [Bacteroidota bacterium]